MKEVDGIWHGSYYNVKITNIQLTCRLHIYFLRSYTFLILASVDNKRMPPILFHIYIYIYSVYYYISFKVCLCACTHTSRTYSFIRIEKWKILVPNLFISQETTLIWSDLSGLMILNGIRQFWTVLLLLIIFCTVINTMISHNFYFS